MKDAQEPLNITNKQIGLCHRCLQFLLKLYQDQEKERKEIERTSTKLFNCNLTLFIIKKHP